MVDRLASRLEREPGDLEGWLRLARAYDVLSEPARSRGALERAAALAPGRADLQLALAQAEAANGDRSKAAQRLTALLGGLTKNAPERAAVESELNRLGPAVNVSPKNSVGVAVIGRLRLPASSNGHQQDVEEMGEAAPALVIEDLHKSFGDLEVLKGISMTAYDGNVIAMIGSSGSGKSTLLRCINLLETRIPAVSTSMAS